MKPNPIAFTAGLVLAVVLGLAERYLLWPQLLVPGPLDLNNPTIRLVYTLVGAIPALAGGYLAARLATLARCSWGLWWGRHCSYPCSSRFREYWRRTAKSPNPPFRWYSLSSSDRLQPPVART